MGWTTIRIREETKQDLKEQSQGENMDEKVQFLLGNIETYIDEKVRSYMERLTINRQTGEVEMR